ncbi:MAG: OmpA family protein, partial [Bacteroidetes bacterium]|nr:OmpA family protein [Bacteroidota bacterium]
MKKIVYLILALTFSCCGLQAAEMDTLRVYFDNGQTGISGFQQSLIDIFLETHFAQGQMIVAGHADDLGDNVTNLNQSRTRATMVAEYLLGKGVAPSQLLLQAWGETKPLVPNTNAINRTKNRRVEIIGLPYRTTNLDVIGLSPKPITLRNGLSVRYKEMTTQDGKPKQVFMIVLRKGEPLEAVKVDSTVARMSFICGFRK